jgi:DNA-directed RNA polymerase specialized sigma24 family protein
LAVEFLDVLERSLSPSDRSLVILRYAHDLDATQLARVTGQSPTAVRKRLERARVALSKEYQR